MLAIESNTLVKPTPAANITLRMPPFPPDAALKQTDRVPLAGLGLPFVGPEAHSLDDLTTAIRAVTREPAVYTGLDFPVPPGGGTLLRVDRLLAAWHGHPWSTSLSLILRQRDYSWTLGLLPIVTFPTSADRWVAAEHLCTLFTNQHTMAIEPCDLIGGDRQAIPGPLPRRWRRPSSRGDVTCDHVQRFFRAFPALVKATTCLLGWNPRSTKSTAPAESANRVAERVLGFSVDLRFGALVAHDDYMQTLVEACGETIVDGRKTTFAACVAKRLQRHGRLVSVPTLEDAGNKLRGAAWSADVNRWVNARESWWRD